MDLKLHHIEPLEREQRLYERVVEKIVALIQDGAWAPGDRLPPERDLAEAFAVSRTVVREAVKTLEARGVLETLSGSGVYVRSPDSAMVSRSLRMYLQLLDQDDIDLRLAEIRCVLEMEIAALAAARATAEERQELRRLCQEMRKHAGAPRVLAEMDFQLHLLLAEATRNELFGVLLTPLIEQLREHFIYAWEHYGVPAGGERLRPARGHRGRGGSPRHGVGAPRHGRGHRLLRRYSASPRAGAPGRQPVAGNGAAPPEGT